MEVFLSIVGCGAGGRELRFRRLEPLTWVFGKKCWHDAYGYMCFAGGDPFLRGGVVAGGGGAAEPARQRLLRGVCLCAKNGDVMLRWLLTQLALKRKS
jgi:hypothetical protein